MHTICLLFLFFLGSPDEAAPQPVNSSKIQAILLLQDQRRGADPQLRRFLSDSDAIVRERAVLACASIQDTLLLPMLVLRLQDETAAVREAAAFAIGQTGTFLSPDGQMELEKDCLDLCTVEGSPPRLVEEMGKFGSASGLSRLVSLTPSKFTGAQRDALIMCIARFAMRGIQADNATRFLVELADVSADVSWQTAYALQRLGPRVDIDIRAVLRLAAHQDPLVRMNAATLLGKLRDTLGSSAVLARLSYEDPDWRVRVNATRAMGMPGPRHPVVIMNQFVRAFSDTNDHVALTAIAAFGEMLKGTGSVPEEAETELWRIAENAGSRMSTRRQAEAFTSLAKIQRPGEYERLVRIKPSNDWMESRLLTALGATGDTLALPLLLRSASVGKPLAASLALEGLQHLAELNRNNRSLLLAVTESAIQALGSRDISVLSTGASMLSDSLFRTPRAVPSLLGALQRLHEPDDVEAMQQIIQTLGLLRDRRAVELLHGRLSGFDRTVAESAAEALQKITGRSFRNQIHLETKPAITTGDSAFLARLPDTVLVHMQTTAGSIMLELYPRIAPFTVMSFLKLAAGRNFFDGLTFHRVVPNFVVQGGDPRGDGWGGPGYSIRSEFSLLRYERGTLGMASAGKDTEGSQFFITHSPQPHLDGRYTIFGKVRAGMDAVDRLQVGDVMTRVVGD